MKEAALFAIGDELLAGIGREGNCSWLAGKLSDIGWQVATIQVLPDEIDFIVSSVGAWLGKVDLIVLSGGLGPTHDDVTREAVSRLLGRPLVLREDLYASILARYAGPIKEAVERSKHKQALIPEGAEGIYNPLGSALAFKVNLMDTEIFVLPGVPREFKAIAEERVLPALDKGGKVREVIRVVGWPESVLKDKLKGLLEEFKEVKLSILPSPNLIKLSLWGTPGDVYNAANYVRNLLSEDILPQGASSLAEAVLLEAEKKQAPVALAESCTGGLLGASLTQIPGASKVFLGGVVCYSNESKIRILKVPEKVIRDHGAVSPECAEAMALGAKELLGSDFALSVTGIAGPDGGTEEKPVGTVCFAISSPKGLEVFQRQFFGDRSNIRDWAVAFGLEKLWRAIKGGCEGGAR